MNPERDSPIGPLAAVAAIAILSTLPALGLAQAVPSDSTGSASGIDGYGTVTWGADSAAVIAAAGRPDTVRTIETLGARALVYAEHQLGRTRGSLGYLVHPAHGLLRVMYLAEYGSGERCLAMYQELRDAIAGMYPEVSKRERMYKQAEDLPFCTAFQLGRAGARAIWSEEDTGARAWVALDLEAGVVRVSLESPRFSEIRPPAPDAGE